MSISIDTYCMECQLRRNAALARSLGSEEKATEFLRRWMALALALPVTAPSPCVGPATNELLHEMYGLDLDRYRAEKEASNAFALANMDYVRRETEQAPDSVYAGLQFAILGNYLDFSALGDKVSFDTLSGMLEKARDIRVDQGTYEKLCADLEKGRKLLYLTDNAGEIGFDRIFAEQMQRKFSHLEITFCVRGGNAANDATRADAAAVGLPFPVIDNGNLVAGTVLEQLSDEARQAMEQADVILSKGMGNVETVVLLSKGEIDSKKVRVEFSLEDMDMSGFQKGATYEQIKAYVLEHTGLKVSSLYISQIKRKCGLDVGQNYNLSKKEDAKVPKCPPEKEAAIRDALKYFQMI